MQRKLIPSFSFQTQTKTPSFQKRCFETQQKQTRSLLRRTGEAVGEWLVAIQLRANVLLDIDVFLTCWIQRLALYLFLFLGASNCRQAARVSGWHSPRRRDPFDHQRLLPWCLWESELSSCFSVLWRVLIWGWGHTVRFCHGVHSISHWFLLGFLFFFQL